MNFSRKSSKEEEISKMLNAANAACRSMFSNELAALETDDYVYSDTEAIEELGLDRELVEQLLEDYVAQILKAMPMFREYISDIEEGVNVDFTLLKDLAHKNLGVARNLRIKDAEKLLYDLMKKDDLQHLRYCLMALELCAIKLKPETAYDTLHLMKIKSDF